MQTLILTLHIIVCVLLVILVLLQSGKEGMGVIFGGGSSSVFGGGGAGGMLAKLTAFMAVLFVITSLSYTYVTSSRPVDQSVILDVKLEETQPPVVPEPIKPLAEPAPAAPVAPAGPATK
ncbi:MAG: preprotein translocase subunit SecG [Desulfovibrionaceae bacterium]